MAQKTTRSKDAKGKKAERGLSERYQKAHETLDKAVRALYKGDPQRAQEHFERLAEGFPEDKELMDRVKLYLAVCEKQISPQKRPKNAEEMTTAGVLYLNSGDTQQAIKMLSKALEAEPKSVHALYCLAAAHARTGDASATARHLKQAIQVDPATRIHARSDQDFAPVRDAHEVAALLVEA